MRYQVSPRSSLHVIDDIANPWCEAASEEHALLIARTLEAVARYEHENDPPRDGELSALAAEIRAFNKRVIKALVEQMLAARQKS